MNRKSYKSTTIFTLLLLLGFSSLSFGQKEVKTYKETFNVSDDAVLDVNTSGTDIVFETWNKDEIEIVATIEIEGATKEEAEAYFNNLDLDITGNSKKIEIKTGSKNSWIFSKTRWPKGHQYDINVESLFSVPRDTLWFPSGLSDSIHMDLVVPRFPELLAFPPVPPMPEANFDYEKFQKEGEAYLKEWQKSFSKGFNKEYEEKLKAWSKRVEAQHKKQEAYTIKRAELLEKRAKKQSELHKKREKLMHKRWKIQDSVHGVAVFSIDSLIGSTPNVYYFSEKGKKKNYKIKKAIKIKMPKTTRLQLNVRHGEVKLAEHTKNMNANLSYTSLHATTISGDQTKIVASYSPVTVKKWNYGQLETDYSDKVRLNEVQNLRLSANSSDVVIDKLMKRVYAQNDFGVLRIGAIDGNFKDVDVHVKNGEVYCTLPNTSYYHKDRDNDRLIVIKSNYSEVLFTN